MLAERLARADVASLGDPDVLGEVDGPHTCRQPHGLPAVADEDHIEIDPDLGEQGVQGQGQLVRPVAHAEDDSTHAGSPRHASHSSVHVSGTARSP